MPNEKADELFQLFLYEEETEKSASLLGELLYDEILPVIVFDLIRCLKHGNNDYDKAKTEAEDLSSEILVSFISRIEKIKAGKFLACIFYGFDLSEKLSFAVFCILFNVRSNLQKITDIQNIKVYFKGAAKLKVNDYRREKDVIWCSLRNRIRHILDKNQDFLYLQSEQLCCLKTGSPVRSNLSFEDLTEALKTDSSILPQTDLPDLMKAVLKKAKGGIKLNELVSVILDIQNIESDMSEISTDKYFQTILQDLTASNNPETSEESLVKLKNFWLEVIRLPFNQRFVFILTTKEMNGFSEIYCFLELGLTSKQEIRELLAMTQTEFDKIFDKLPLPDKEAADILSAKLKHINLNTVEVTEKQVSNLRQVAKGRLLRKLKNIE